MPKKKYTPEEIAKFKAGATDTIASSNEDLKDKVIKETPTQVETNDVDYKVLTPQERNDLREELAKTLTRIMGRVKCGDITPKKAANEFIELQTHIGEDLKDFTSKLGAAREH